MPADSYDGTVQRKGKQLRLDATDAHGQVEYHPLSVRVVHQVRPFASFGVLQRELGIRR